PPDARDRERPLLRRLLRHRSGGEPGRRAAEPRLHRRRAPARAREALRVGLEGAAHESRSRAHARVGGLPRSGRGAAALRGGWRGRGERDRRATGRMPARGIGARRPMMWLRRSMLSGFLWLLIGSLVLGIGAAEWVQAEGGLRVVVDRWGIWGPLIG